MRELGILIRFKEATKINWSVQFYLVCLVGCRSVKCSVFLFGQAATTSSEFIKLPLSLPWALSESLLREQVQKKSSTAEEEEEEEVCFGILHQFGLPLQRRRRYKKDSQFNESVVRLKVYCAVGRSVNEYC